MDARIIVQRAPPERGTYRSFTGEEIEHLGAPWASLRRFMWTVLAPICIERREFYPRQETQNAIDN